MNFFKKLFKKDIEKEIDEKIKHFVKKHGKTKEIKELSEITKEDRLKDDFFDIIFKLSYTSNKRKRKELTAKAELIASKIPGLKGWPRDSKKFWDVEAYAWLGKIPRRIREFIRKELMKRIPLGTLNLGIGSGSYPYIEDSVLLDLSREMLKLVTPVKSKAKIEYDLEKGKLPFQDNSFDSVTMVFVIDYLKNLKQVLKETKRILKKNGKLILVNSKKPIDSWYRKHEVKHYTRKEIKLLLKQIGFKVKIEEKKIDKIVLLFVEGIK
ncbi:class I SAM-dependent methyltransferase [Candidatus Woesearchaeota archaeon]|nr:class I SAM-dependent methyltransferase [Candidatus Woesearchaeota archaeon]